MFLPHGRAAQLWHEWAIQGRTDPVSPNVGQGCRTILANRLFPPRASPETAARGNRKRQRTGCNRDARRRRSPGTDAQPLLGILPRSRHRPVAVTDGSVPENINEIGVRFWTDCSRNPQVLSCHFSHASSLSVKTRRLHRESEARNPRSRCRAERFDHGSSTPRPDSGLVGPARLHRTYDQPIA